MTSGRSPLSHPARWNLPAEGSPGSAHPAVAWRRAWQGVRRSTDRKAHQFGPGLQRTRIELRPAHRVVDVLHGGRIRVLVARAEIEPNRDDAVLGHGFMAQALGGAVAQTTGAAVAFDQCRKRPLPAGPEYAREQRLVAVTELFDILHVELMSSRFEHCSRHSHTYFRGSSLTDLRATQP